MNNKGNFMIGILILLMAMVLFVGTLPVLSKLFNDARGCSSLNCAGYVDKSETVSGSTCTSSNQSYQAGLEESTLACTITDLGIPFIVLGVIIAAISLLLYNKLGMTPQEQPQYGGY